MKDVLNRLILQRCYIKNPETSFVASFVGESNEFEVVSYGDGQLFTKHGCKLFKPGLDFQPKKLFIRPEAFILDSLDGMSDVEVIDIRVKTILFDGSNTKVSAIIKESNDEVLISLPQNAKFEDLEEGDDLKVGIHRDDLKCYRN